MATTTPTAPSLMSPVAKCAKVWAKLTKKQVEESEFSFIEWSQTFRSFIQDVVTKESNCKDLRLRPTACSCMAGGALSYDDINDCAHYLVDFSKKKKVDRQAILLDWMKYAGVMKRQLAAGPNARVYLLPG